MASSKRKLSRLRSSSVDTPNSEADVVPEIEITQHFTSVESDKLRKLNSRHSLPFLITSTKYSKPKVFENDSSLTPPTKTQSLNRYDNSLSNYYDGYDDSDNRIKVHINLTKYRIGLPHGICTLETLGIVLNKYTLSGRSSSLLRQGKRKSLPVIIKKIILGSPASLTEQLDKGDEIVSVNGHDVNMKNIGQVLSEISQEVIFDVNKRRDHQSVSPPTTLEFTDVVDRRSLSPLVYSPLLLYLTLDTKENDPPEKDILFYYPMDSFHKILQVRGTFLTLSNIVSSFSSSSYTSYSVNIDGKFYHVSSHLNDKNLLLVALEDINGSVSDSMILLNRIKESFNLLYDSLDNAFCTQDSVVIDILSVLFQLPFTPYSFVYSNIRQLPLPIKLTSQLSTYLSQLDSTSYNSSHTGSTGLSSCGSCLFYKSYLICYHLSTDLLHCIYNVCQCYDLLNQTSTAHLPRLTTLWKQIYTESKNLFVLIIGMEHTILCQIFELKGKTDSELNDRVKQICFSVLEEIHSTGLLSDCERRILLSLPVLTSADVLLASRLTAAAAKGGRVSRSSTGSIYSLNTIGTLSDTDSDCSISSKSKTLPRKSSSTMFRSLRLSLRHKRKNKSMHSLSDSPSSYTLSMSAPRESYMLTAGMENHLLYYVCLQTGRGLMMSPCDIHVSSQAVHSLLLETFREVSSSIHYILHQKRQEEEEGFNDDEFDDKVDSNTTGNNELFTLSGCPVIEHGVLVQCSLITTKGPPLNYWIIGRLFDDDKELFVCYQENMSQTSVEMSFKLLFGSNFG